MTKNYDPFQPRIWKLAHGRTLELGASSVVMGILNVTPDSFSDGGRFTDLSAALDQAAEMVRGGAKIIDVGGESTRPGAQEITCEEEQERVLPVIEMLKNRFDVAISIDTWRVETAELSLKEGAHVINDVMGLQQQDNMAELIARYDAGVCIMHNSRNRELLPDVIEDQFYYLERSLQIASDCGIGNIQIVLDPGFGFGKDAKMNLEVLAKFSKLMKLEYPWICGTSRKRFIGGMLGEKDSEPKRDIATSATSVIARMQGASIFRVHDVITNVAALKAADAVIDTTR